MDNCFDIILENEDYTIGKLIEFLLYSKYYEGDKTLSFCGFKKLHPHDLKSIIRVAFQDNSDKTIARQYMRSVCNDAHEIYKIIYKMF